MLRTIAIILAVIAVAIGGIFTYASTRPDSFVVERSATINAPAEKIFLLINDLHAFNSWNPFTKQDPASKGSYQGPQSGKGAAYQFEGGSSGSGSIEIVNTAPPSKVEMRLQMIEPIAADNQVEFNLEPQGGATRVTWSMNGGVPLIGKVLHLFVNMDRMVGGAFEQGLADLKATAERS
jgi:hypothetical protein